jgi:hypothetical protein
MRAGGNPNPAQGTNPQGANAPAEQRANQRKAWAEFFQTAQAIEMENGWKRYKPQE